MEKSDLKKAMRTNIEKWDYHMGVLKKKTDAFVDSQKEGKTIPDIYYVVYPSGKIAERNIIEIEYSHYKHDGRTYFNGKKPTKKDIAEIAEYSIKDIPFSVENIYFKYSEIWDKEKNRTSISSVKFNDVVNKKGLFYSFDKAEAHSLEVLEWRKEEKEFKDKYKKDSGYNYEANGYKFLGWQNGWKHVYFDEEGNETTDESKKKTFGYRKEDYPEYGRCMELKHRRIEISTTASGSENIVSCPECKIYWKYDCS